MLRTSPLRTPLHADCQAAVDLAGKLCMDLGHTVEEVSPELDWTTLMEAFFPAMIAILPQAVANLETAIGRKAGPDTLEPMTLRVLDYARTLTIADLFKADAIFRSEEHPSELQSQMRISYAV